MNYYIFMPSYVYIENGDQNGRELQICAFVCVLTLVVLGRRLRSLARCALIRSRRRRSASLWLLEAANALASMISCAVIFPSSRWSPMLNGDDDDDTNPPVRTSASGPM